MRAEYPPPGITRRRVYKKKGIFMRSQRGFTLIEIIIIVVILGIVAGIVYPVFNNTNSTIFSEATNDQFAVLLQNASMLAMATGKSTLVEFESNKITVWSARGVEEAQTLPNINITTNLPGNVLVYNPKGKPVLGTSNTGVVTISGNNINFQLTIYPDGRIVGGGGIS